MVQSLTMLKARIRLNYLSLLLSCLFQVTTVTTGINKGTVFQQLTAAAVPVEVEAGVPLVAEVRLGIAFSPNCFLF